MKFRNLTSGEVMNVSNIRLREGRIFFQVRGKGCGTKFFNRNKCLILDEHVEDGTYLSIADGWVLDEAPKERKARTPKAPKQEVVVEQPKVEEEACSHSTPPASVANEEEEAYYAKEIEIRNNVGLETESLLKELQAKYGTMGADIFAAAEKLANVIRPQAQVSEEEVVNIVDQRMKAWQENGRQPKVIEVVTPRGVNKVEGSVCKDFVRLCNLMESGKPIYMYGSAGCGKSYTAKQIADAMGYDYYETSQAMFAHELKGYGDAKGEFVETAFYRAFSKGGVFFLDEVDASAPEALVVLNNAIANKRFDFPVIGNIEAHKNFRVIAAGNTRMTGATMEYTARQMQDTSFKNRFFFVQMTYSRDVMLAITGGDDEIVNFGADLRRAARETGISQLFSYRQATDLATLQLASEGDDEWLLRGSVLQEKEIDDAVNLYEHLQDKSNRWAKAMKKCIETMKNEEVW